MQSLISKFIFIFTILIMSVIDYGFSQNQENVIVFAINHQEIHTIDYSTLDTIIKEGLVALYLMTANAGDSIEIHIYKDSNNNMILDPSDSLSGTVIAKDGGKYDKFSTQPRLIKHSINYLLETLNPAVYFISINTEDEYEKIVIAKKDYVHVPSRLDIEITLSDFPNYSNLYTLEELYRIYLEELYKEEWYNIYLEELKARSKDGVYRMDTHNIYDKIYYYDRKRPSISNLLLFILNRWPALKESYILNNMNVLNNSHESVLYSALYYLNELDISELILNKSEIEMLFQLLSNESDLIRNLAIEILSKYSNETVLEFLKKNLKNEDERIRADVINIIDNINDKRTFYLLIKDLEDKSEDIRLSALKALKNFQNKQIIEPIFKLLGDESDIVRDLAIDILSEYRYKSVYRLLKKSLKDEDERVRAGAIKIIGYIGDKRTFDLLTIALKDKSEENRYNAVVALSLLEDSRSIKPLINMLKDKKIKFRQSAAQALGNIKDIRAVEPLIALLNDNEIKVRESAILSLGQIGDYRAFEPLILMLNDSSSDVQIATIHALGELKDIKAIRPLLFMMKNSNQLFRLKIAETIDIIVENANNN